MSLLVPLRRPEPPRPTPVGVYLLAIVLAFALFAFGGFR